MCKWGAERDGREGRRQNEGAHTRGLASAPQNEGISTPAHQSVVSVEVLRLGGLSPAPAPWSQHHLLAPGWAEGTAGRASFQDRQGGAHPEGMPSRRPPPPEDAGGRAL